MSVFVFVFGLIIGSFLSCLIYRLETEQGFVTGRSFCPECKHVLGWKDLIPLLSFLLLRGRCRYCQKKISWQYPLVELATGLLFILVFWQWSSSPGPELGLDPLNFTHLLFMSSLLIVIFVFDLKHYLIPDEIVYPGIAVTLAYRLLEIRNLESLLNPLASAAFASLFFVAIYFFSQGRAMGFGDVKLAFLMGLFLGFPKIIVALFFAFFSGAAIGATLMLAGKKKLKSELPFAPFLVAGTALAFFAGSEIAKLYLGLFF